MEKEATNFQLLVILALVVLVPPLPVGSSIWVVIPHILFLLASTIYFLVNFIGSISR